MPRVRWGDEEELREAMDNWDPESQIQPYDGPTPPNGLYYWDIKVLKYRQGKNLPQLMIGLELAPRRSRPEDKKYAKYWIMDFASISPQTNFRYMPFLQAIGVSNEDFLRKLYTDEDGNVTKIGRWVKREKGNWIAANLVDDTDQNGNARKGIGSYFAPKESGKAAPAESEEEEYEEEEYEEAEEYEQEYEAGEEDAEAELEEEEEYEEEPPPPPRKTAKKAVKRAAKKAPAKKAAATRRRKPAEVEEDDEPPF